MVNYSHAIVYVHRKNVASQRYQYYMQIDLRKYNMEIVGLGEEDASNFRGGRVALVTCGIFVWLKADSE
jgi:hypothetical protein